MNTKFLFLLIFCLLAGIGHAQNSTVFKTDMDAVFQVNRSFVTTGLLKDYGLLLTDVTKFNGTLQTNNMADRDVWQVLYSSLYFMKFNATATLPSPTSVNTTIASYAATINGKPVNNILALHYNYEQFKTNAATGNLVNVTNGQIFDTPNRPSTPYEIKTTFSMAPELNVMSGGTQVFRFRNELFFKNVNQTINSVQIDFGDGGGFRTITSGADNTINYTTEGVKTLVFKVNYTDGTVMQSKSEVIVYDVIPVVQVARFIQNAPDNISLPVVNSSIPVLPDMGTGQAQIYYGGTDLVLNKPLIIVEGFDPSNTRDASVIFTDGLLLGTRIIIDGVEKPMYQHLDDNNFDIVYLNFTDATTDIRRNARLLEYLIQWVNQKKALNGSTERNVVMGASMGGLVACFGLRDMELRGINHDTKLYGSFDTAHLGVNVPLGFQAAVRYMAGLSLEGIAVKDFVPALGNAVNTIGSTSVQQMLFYQWQGTGSGITINNTPHNNFLTEYSNMGMPRLWGIRNIAVANGSECGVNQGYAPYTSMLSVNKSKDVKYLTNILASMGLAFLQTQSWWLKLPAVWGAFAFNLLVTDSDLEISAEIKSLPDKQVQPVFTFNLSYRKVILFGLITKTKTLFSTSQNSTADMLPLDSSPGGSFNLLDYTALPTVGGLTIGQSRFSFLPTPSAIYMGTGTQALTTLDLNKPYSRAFPPSGLKNIPFDNFFTNPTVNEKHVQITDKNGAWMYNEFRGTPTIFSCSYVCSGTSIAPIISGASIVCSANSTFTVSNIPSGSPITWGKSSNLNFVSGQGTSNITVNSNSIGSGFVNVFTSGQCGTGPTVTKTLSVGTGASPTFLTIGRDDCFDQRFSTDFAGGAAVYNWTMLNLSNNTSTFYPQRNYQLITGLGAGNYRVVVASACPSVTALFQNFTIVCGASAQLAISPNPTSTSLTVEIVTDPAVNNLVIDKVQLLSDIGIEIREWHGSTRKAEVDVRGLQKGFYYAKVFIGGEITTTRILIE